MTKTTYKSGSNSVTVQWKGLDNLDTALESLPVRVQRGALKGLEAIGVLVKNAAQRLILKGAKSGKIYKRRTIVHQASAPGQPPASDTGTLVRSLVHDLDKQNLDVEVSASTKYAKWLEFGTKKMAARPFLSVALNNNKRKMKVVITKFVKNEISNG